MRGITASLARLRPRGDSQFVNWGRTVCATGSDGWIVGREHGLFVHQTRLLSRYRYLIEGEPPLPVALSPVEHHTWLGYYIAPVPGGSGTADQGSGQVAEAAQQALELRVFRRVGEGLREEITLTNFTQRPVHVRFAVEIDADFADREETAGERRQRGRITREWREGDGAGGSLHFCYSAEHTRETDGNRSTARLQRGAILRVVASDSPAGYNDGAIVFGIHLAPAAAWHAQVELIPRLEEELAVLDRAVDEPEAMRRQRLYLTEATGFRGPSNQDLTPVVLGALEQAKADLAALRLYDLDHDDRSWTMAAGLPIYIALFGRDTLTAGWQAALSSPAMMRGALAELARWQGKVVDHWRDEEPGRMLHEAHTGPLAALDVTPRRRYYGSATTSGFYPFVLSELWHWAGDKEWIRPFIAPALRALRWCNEYGDLDGDGFVEYLSHSDQGVRHQGWKDSGDAIVYADGSQVDPPIATCEEQAFVYAAKLHLSEVLWWLGERDEARRLFREARELKKRFNEAFWMEEEGFLAMGLDAQKRQITSIGSNPGHCLASGIVDGSLTGRIAERLMRDDLFSGWGIRTLSSRHPAYNPYSYHRGTIWPVENGTFALAFMRYGLHDDLDRLSRGQFEAAALFEHYRLPELFGGHPRDVEHPFPALYPRANWPQAWSSSAIFSHLQSLLGLYPYAPLGVLFIDPHLPAWLPEITLTGLRVGTAVASLRFFREENGRSGYEVLEVAGRLRVIRQPSPWSLSAGLGERIADAVTSIAPAKSLAGAGLLALGAGLLARRVIRERRNG